MNRVFTAIWLGLAACAALSSAADATQVLRRTPRELGAESALVVRGEVVEVRSYWNEKRTKIFTAARIAVGETFKGGSASTIDVIQLGGVVDNVKVNVQGALAWEPGEEVVLFLEPYDGSAASAAAFQVSGFSQGKFAVERDPRTGKAFVNRPEATGVELVGASSPASPEASSRIENVPIEQFIDEALGRRP
jgi:hypothetical protein